MSVTIDGVWIGNRIHWTLKQLVTTFYGSLSHTDYCSPSRFSLRFLVAASISVAFWAFLSNGSCPRWLAPFSCSSRTVLTSSQLPNSKFKVMLRSTIRRPVCLGVKHPSVAEDYIFVSVRQLRVCWCGAPSLMRRRVCPLQLLLALSSAVILRSELRRTHDHILLSQIRDSPNLEGKVPVFISPRNRVAQLYP
jgi:hypothetical protein